jgi:hypothetical protein
MFIATITGNVGRDPEAKTGDYEGVQFSFAVKYGYTKSQGNLIQWVTVDAMGPKAQYVLANVKKGDKVSCIVEIRRIVSTEGKLQMYARLIEIDGGTKRVAPGIDAPSNDFDEMPF